MGRRRNELSEHPGRNRRIVATVCLALGIVALPIATATAQVQAVPPELSKAFSPNSIVDGGVSTLTFTIDNSTSDLAPTNLAFTDSLPAGVTIATPSNASTTCVGGTLTAPAGGSTISYSGGSVGVRSGCTVSVDVTSATVGTHSNVSSGLTSDEFPDDPGGPAAADLFVTAEADLSIVKSDTADPVAPGATVKYTLTVSNAGPSEAEDVVVTDTLPSGVALQSTSGCAEDPAGVPTCSLGSIPSGGFTSYSITVSSPSASGQITNAASVTSATPDPNSSNNVASENTDIEVGVTTVPGLYNDADFLSYPVTVNGSYQPLVGRFTTNGIDDVLWYGAGSAPDYMWTDVRATISTNNLDYRTMPVTVNGTYQPFVFDLDEDGFDDVFWYAPGSAADFVWYFNGDGTYDSFRTQVRGTYQPVPGVFIDGKGGFAGIFWYGPGSTRETFWHQTAPGETGRGQFASSSAPQVNGTYQAAAFNARRASSFKGGGIVFVNEAGQDYVWIDAEPAGDPMTSVPVDLGDGPAQVFSGPDINRSAVIYRPGSAADSAVSYDQPSGRLNTQAATMNGTYRAASGFYSSIVWHGPGSAPDYVWIYD